MWSKPLPLYSVGCDGKSLNGHVVKGVGTGFTPVQPWPLHKWHLRQQPGWGRGAIEKHG